MPCRLLTLQPLDSFSSGFVLYDLAGLCHLFYALYKCASEVGIHKLSTERQRQSRRTGVAASSFPLLLEAAYATRMDH